jgi:hypothetical protein
MPQGRVSHAGGRPFPEFLPMVGPPHRPNTTAYWWTACLLAFWFGCTLAADELSPLVRELVTDVEQFLGLDTVPPPAEEPS